jgi:hypothetical protein
MENIIDWEWVRSDDTEMEFTLVMGTTERIASYKTNGHIVNLENLVKIPRLMQSTVEFVIVKLACGCEWKATSQTQGVNRICDQHYIRDIVDDVEAIIDAAEATIGND